MQSERAFAVEEKPMIPDGIYAAYMSGKTGVSVLLLAISKGVMVGVDVGGLKYDGTVKETAEGYDCSAVYTIPPGTPLITGPLQTNEPVKVPYQFKLPRNFLDASTTVRLETPLGPVNARFEKLRDLP
jgi:hypothetical protein